MKASFILVAPAKDDSYRYSFFNRTRLKNGCLKNSQEEKKDKKFWPSPFEAAHPETVYINN